MPIISKIGARSLKVRAVYAVIYVLLITGAVTMVYPFLLMISGSVKSETDFVYISPFPRFWTSDLVLFQKYAESKYNVRTDNLEMAWWEEVGSWRKVARARPTSEADRQLLSEFRDWRKSFAMPLEWYALGHSSGGRMLPICAREFRNQLYERYKGKGGIDAFRKEMAVPFKSWAVVFPPADYVGYSRRYRPRLEGFEVAYRRFKASRPVHDRIIFNLDGIFWRTYLKPKYTADIAEYNRLHNTKFTSYHEVFLTRRAPAAGLQRKDWEEFVRKELNLHFVRLDADLADAYRRRTAEKYGGNIEQFNRAYGTSFTAFSQIPFSTTVPAEPIAQVDWDDFIKDREACPLEGIEVYGPRQAFEQYVARRRGKPLERIAPLRLPIAEADYQDTLDHARALRWEFTTRNYKQVLQYILLHGRGIVNTLIYCALAISTALLVNPLAAYALSRYKPPSTYTILLFCMATMAFPGEVTMIPAFLLLKRFPLWPLVAGGISFGVTLWVLSKLAGRWPESARMVLSLGLGVLVGAWGVPAVLEHPTVSLLNTFAALILPGMANGYFIFLLKGFFDSLPRELYEAADVDGASEWTKFWTITMSLSKPILAVIALGAFTAAYSAFMMALIIIPDQDMWTLMVWIFQLQSNSHQAVIYASLVIAAIPTFLVFALCQNVIMRGIVVPVEK